MKQEIYTELSAPIKSVLVKKTNGETYLTITKQSIINRLNNVFGVGGWQLVVDKEVQVYQDSVVVSGHLEYNMTDNDAPDQTSNERSGRSIIPGVVSTGEAINNAEIGLLKKLAQRIGIQFPDNDEIGEKPQSEDQPTPETPKQPAYKAGLGSELSQAALKLEERRSDENTVTPAVPQLQTIEETSSYPDPVEESESFIPKTETPVIPLTPPSAPIESAKEVVDKIESPVESAKPVSPPQQEEPIPTQPAPTSAPAPSPKPSNSKTSMFETGTPGVIPTDEQVLKLKKDLQTENFEALTADQLRTYFMNRSGLDMTWVSGGMQRISKNRYLLVVEQLRSRASEIGLTQAFAEQPVIEEKETTTEPLPLPIGNPTVSQNLLIGDPDTRGLNVMQEIMTSLEGRGITESNWSKVCEICGFGSKYKTMADFPDACTQTEFDAAVALSF